MFKVKTSEPETRPIQVSLKDDNGDVDIYLNEISVAWFDADTHALQLHCLSNAEQKELGISIVANHIEVQP